MYDKLENLWWKVEDLYALLPRWKYSLLSREVQSALMILKDTVKECRKWFNGNAEQVRYFLTIDVPTCCNNRWHDVSEYCFKHFGKQFLYCRKNVNHWTLVFFTTLGISYMALSLVSQALIRSGFYITWWPQHSACQNSGNSGLK